MEILSAVRDCFTPAAIHRLTSYLREQEAGIRRTIDQSIPTTTAAIIQLLDRRGGAETFLRLLDESSHHRGMLIELPAILSSRHSALAMLALGEQCRDEIFGKLCQPVAAAIAAETGVALESAFDTLALTTLLTMEVISRDVARRGLLSVEIIEELEQLRGQAWRALPAEVAKHIELYAMPIPGVMVPEAPPAPWMRVPWLAKLFA